jgi:hypothetical protein
MNAIKIRLASNRITSAYEDRQSDNKNIVLGNKNTGTKAIDMQSVNKNIGTEAIDIQSVNKNMVSEVIKTRFGGKYCMIER